MISDLNMELKDDWNIVKIKKILKLKKAKTLNSLQKFQWKYSVPY